MTDARALHGGGDTPAAPVELHADQLLNRRVVDLDGKTVGHLEEICVRRGADGWRVEEYHVGAYALFVRLGGWPLGRAMLGALGLRRKGDGYRVPWNVLDVQADRLVLRCPVDALQHLDEADEQQAQSQ
jgi:hypothetical protein